MKYRYKNTGAVVESGIRLNPAIFEPVTEEENTSAKENVSAIAEEISAEDIHVEEAADEPASTADSNISSVKASAGTAAKKTTTVKKTTATKKTTSTKK